MCQTKTCLWEKEEQHHGLCNGNLASSARKKGPNVGQALTLACSHIGLVQFQITPTSEVQAKNLILVHTKHFVASKQL
jgi:hypothetical protein